MSHRQPTTSRRNIQSTVDSQATGSLVNLVVVIPARNDSEWLPRNFGSLAGQRYQNFRVIYIDDCSTDNTPQAVSHWSHHYQLTDRLTYLRTPERNYQGCSRFLAYHLCRDSEVICMLDGDDWLADPHALSSVVSAYRQGAMATYGSYRRFSGGATQSFVYASGPAEQFPPEVIQQRSFRKYRWLSQHLRTGYAALYKRIALTDLIDPNNQFYRCCTDLAEMFPVLEMAGSQLRQINRCVYIYNTDASKRSQYSYFTQQQRPNSQQYRHQVTARIRGLPKYPKVTWKELVQTRNLTASYQFLTQQPTDPSSDIYQDTDFWVSHTPAEWKQEQVGALVKLLDACQLPLLLVGAEVKNGRQLYVSGIQMGFLAKIPEDPKIITSESQYLENSISLQNLVGQRCLTVQTGVSYDLNEIWQS